MTTLTIYRAAVEVVTVNIDEKTLYTKKLMGDHKITTEFYSSTALSLAIGDYVTYNSENFYINRLPDVEKINSFTFKYRIDFESVLYDLGKKLFISSDDLADFSYTGEPTDFITNIVANLNVTGSGWTVGTVDAGDSVRIDFHNVYCSEALRMVAEKFGMEFSLSGKEISLRDSVGVTKAYTFKYGEDLGLYKITRQQVNNQNIITKCYGYGGTRNIPYDYRSRAKRLTFAAAGMAASGYLVSAASGLYGTIEGQFTDDNIYPQRTSTLTGVNMVFDSGTSGTDYNPRSSYIEDSALDFDINDYLIEGLTAKVVFKSGDLSGVECEIWKYDNANKRIYLNAYTDQDGYALPFYNGGSPVIPNTGDSYTLVDMKMPASYVTAAETSLQAATQAYLDENSVPQVVYGLDIDPKYAASKSVSLDVGDKVTVIDSDLGIYSLIRIAGIEFPLINEYQIKATIADFVPCTLQERIIKTSTNNKQNILTVNKDAEELARLNSAKLHRELAKKTIPMYQGVYNAGTTYYGNPSRIDIVKYDIPDDDPDAGYIYYIARPDAPSESFSGIVPTNTDYWERMPVQYSSVATQLLFAELAYIDNLGVKYFNGVAVPVGDLAGSASTTQANVALSPAWDQFENYDAGDKCSSAGVNYVAHTPNTNQIPPNSAYWSVDPSQPVARIDKVTLTGTSGTANVTCSGVTKMATWNDNGLADTAADFAALWASAYLVAGVILTSDGADIVFTAQVPGVNFSGSTSISNVANSFRGSLKMQGNEIWENAEDNDTFGCIAINRKGYNAGISRYRHLFVGNGKGQWIAYFYGQSPVGQIWFGAQSIEMPNIPSSSPGGDGVWRDGSGYLRIG